MTSQSLTVDFVGEAHELGPEDTLEFGRGAELNIDSNPFFTAVSGDSNSGPGSGSSATWAARFILWWLTPTRCRKRLWRRAAQSR